MKVGDIVSIRVKIASITEEENNKYTFKVKSLSNDYQNMVIGIDDITATTMNVPTEIGKEV